MRSSLHATRALCQGWTAAGVFFLISAWSWGQNIDEELPLPRWEQEPPSLHDPNSPGSQFNALLPGSIIPAPPIDKESPHLGPRLEDAPEDLTRQIGPTDLSLFLHGSLLGSSRPSQAPRAPTPALSLRDLPTALLPSLHDSPSNEYLIDPQNLVPEVARGDLERLLAFHASDARIRLYLLVLNADQKWPAEADPALIARGALSRQNACLAVYPLGEPWRARLFLSQTVHQSAAQESLIEMAGDCIRDAQQVEEAAEQLQRYVVRLCTRLYWLQSSLPPAENPVLPQSSSRPLREISSEATPSNFFTPDQRHLSLLGALLGSALLLLLIGQSLRRWQQRRFQHSSTCVWVLPEPEILPRLGGAFSAGAGAHLHYKR